jgi:hypothetical protein
MRASRVNRFFLGQACAAFERAAHEIYGRVRIKLAALERRVAEVRLKSAEKIGAAAAAIHPVERCGPQLNHAPES